MPIAFDLKALKEKHDCVNYFETGLWDPRTEISSKKALSCGFDKVYCIEIREDWVYLGNHIFKEYIANGVYNLYWDDSTNMKKYIATDHFTPFYISNADFYNIIYKKCI
jgi:hypothetical protein